MSSYGFGDGETIITEYLDSHLENGIKQKNLDKGCNVSPPKPRFL